MPEPNIKRSATVRPIVSPADLDPSGGADRTGPGLHTRFSAVLDVEWAGSCLAKKLAKRLAKQNLTEWKALANSLAAAPVSQAYLYFKLMTHRIVSRKEAPRPFSDGKCGCGPNGMLVSLHQAAAMLTEGRIAFLFGSSTISSLRFIWSPGLGFASTLLVEQHRFDEVRHGPVLFFGSLLDEAEKLRLQTQGEGVSLGFWVPVE